MSFPYTLDLMFGSEQGSLGSNSHINFTPSSSINKTYLSSSFTLLEGGTDTPVVLRLKLTDFNFMKDKLGDLDITEKQLLQLFISNEANLQAFQPEEDPEQVSTDYTLSALYTPSKPVMMSANKAAVVEPKYLFDKLYFTKFQTPPNWENSFATFNIEVLKENDGSLEPYEIPAGSTIQMEGTSISMRFSEVSEE